MREKDDYYNEGLNHQDLQLFYDYFDAAFAHPKPITTDLIIMNEKLENPRQKIIQMDSLRTRSDIFDEQTKHQLQIMLTHYCRLHEIQYKQGLNEIAGPFIYFRKIGASLGKCEILFHNFFSQYCLNFYHDKDFNSIEMFSRMFSIVLKYHIPSVFRFLEWHKIQPQIFCISWLMTLFAGKLSLKMVYELWQFYITENDKFFLFFLAVGIMLYNKENIIETKNVNILETVTHLVFRGQEEMRNVIAISLLLRKNTPCSLVIFFRDRMIFEKRSNYQAIAALLEHIENLNLFLVLPSEMILETHYQNGLCQSECYFCDLRKPLKPYSHMTKFLSQINTISNDIRQLKYEKEFVIVDVRRVKEVKIQFKGPVFEIDIENDIETIEEKFLKKYMEEKGKKHFIFILSQFSFQDIENCDERQLDICKDMLTILISMSFPFLSILQGGYTAFFSHIEEQKSIKPSQTFSEMVLQEKQAKLPLKLSLSLSEMFMVGKSILSNEIKFFVGVVDIILITKYSIMVLRNDEETVRFLNYFKHNNSIIDFLYKRISSRIFIQIRDTIFIRNLVKISMKFYHQNIIVFMEESCPMHHHHSAQIEHYLQQPKLNGCKECGKKKRKVPIELENADQVSVCTEMLKKKYKALLKE